MFVSIKGKLIVGAQGLVWREGSSAAAALGELLQLLNTWRRTRFCSALVRSHVSTLDDPSVDISLGVRREGERDGEREEGRLTSVPFHPPLTPTSPPPSSPCHPSEGERRGPGPE